MRNEPCGRDIVIPYILYFILNFRMKRFRFCLVAGMLLFISVSTVAKGVPTSIQAAFEKMYPYVANAQWEQMAGCYVAEFVIDGRETDVWFDENAQWVMMENDVERWRKFPLPLRKHLWKALWRLRDVRIVTFPKRPAVIVSKWKATIPVKNSNCSMHRTESCNGN